MSKPKVENRGEISGRGKVRITRKLAETGLIRPLIMNIREKERGWVGKQQQANGRYLSMSTIVCIYLVFSFLNPAKHETKLPTKISCWSSATPALAHEALQ